MFVSKKKFCGKNMHRLLLAEGSCMQQMVGWLVENRCSQQNCLSSSRKGHKATLLL